MALSLVITGDEAKALAALDKVIGRQQKLIKKLEDINKKGKKTGNTFKKAFNFSNLSKFVVGLTGAGGVLAGLRLITAEFRQQVELQRKSADQQITLSSARKGLIRNLAGSTPAQVKEVLKSGKEIAKTTNVDEKFIVKGLAAAVSASGGNIPAAQAATKQAALTLADVPEAIGAFAGSLLDLSKVTGSLDAKVNQGLLAKTAALSRVVSPQQQAQNIPRSLIGQAAFGSTAAGAASLFAALTVGSGDITGATSGTASISLAKQLKEFLPELGTTTERIRAVQADPKLGEEFLASSSFEVVALGPIRKLLTDTTSSVALQFTENLKQIPNAAGLARIAEDQLALFNVDPLEKGAKKDRAFKSTEQQLLATGLLDAEGGITREGLTNVLKASGQGFVASKIAGASFEAQTLLGKDPTEVAIGQLNKRIDELTATTQEVAFSRFGPVDVPRVPTERENEQADILRELKTELQELNRNVVEGNDRQRGGPGLVPFNVDR